MNPPGIHQIATCSQEYGKWAKQVRSRWESRKERKMKSEAKKAAGARERTVQQHESGNSSMGQSTCGTGRRTNDCIKAGPTFEPSLGVHLRESNQPLTLASLGLTEQAALFQHVLQVLDDKKVPFLDQAQALTLARMPVYITPRTQSPFREMALKQQTIISETQAEPCKGPTAPATSQDSRSKWTSSLRRDESNPEYWFRRQVEYLQHMEERYQEDFSPDWLRLGLQPDEGRAVDPARARVPQM